jgi:hypothetical protein
MRKNYLSANAVSHCLRANGFKPRGSHPLVLFYLLMKNPGYEKSRLVTC